MVDGGGADDTGGGEGVTVVTVVDGTVVEEEVGGEDADDVVPDFGKGRGRPYGLVTIWSGGEVGTIWSVPVGRGERTGSSSIRSM